MKFVQPPVYRVKMADNRFSSWKEDDLLKDALKKYVKQGLQREEAIDFFAERLSLVCVEHTNTRQTFTPFRSLLQG